MEKFFRPRARLILQLGDQLIKNESIALLELVKNSYDADASIVNVSMTNVDTADGMIVIKDDGEGMDSKIIEDAWLELGSDFKKIKLENNERTEKFKRLPIGEKGIGRFGLHKLGNEIEIISKRKNHKEVVVKIDFRNFEREKYLDKAPILVTERKPLEFTNNTGTKIIIRSLKQHWDRNTVRRVHRSLLNLNSPFQKIDSFKVNFKIDKPKWLDGLLTFANIKNYSLYYFDCLLEGGEIKKFKYEFRPWPTLTKVKPRSVTEKDQEIRPFIKLLHEVEVYDEKTQRFKKEKKQLDLDQGKIGPVKFEGYIFTLSPKILGEGMESGRDDLRSYLNENGGISIYRDKLRINEYGDKGVDWLNLDIRRVNTPGEKISNNLLLAAIDLDREFSSGLIEKTNREGFVDNQYFRDFSDAINYTLDIVENLRGTDKDQLNEKYTSSKISEPVIDSLNNLRALVEKKLERGETKSQLMVSIDSIEKEYIQINEILLASAGAGLSLSIVLHEIEKITYELNLVVKSKGVPERIFALAKHLSDLVKGYGEIIRQSKYTKEDLKRIINGALFNVEYRLENHKIQVIDNSKKFTGPALVRCSKRLVLSSIMNIIDNSIFWLDFKEKQLTKGDKFSKKIFIDLVDHKDGWIKLLIADNGKGITIPTEQMVKPFISEKPNGMGLGLHIVNEIMKAHNGKLEFPNIGDYEMPKDFQKGAKVVLSFKK